MDKIQLRQLFDYESWTYTYVLWDSATKESIIIDPVLEQADRDLNILKKLDLNLIYILETHVHADHITAASLIKEKTNAKICYGSKTGVEGADLLLDDGQKIKIGCFEICAIHTPGHTEGCTSYFVEKYVFTGDTLFIGGTGRTDFQGGSSSDVYDSVKNKIFCFPDDTIVYPAHNYQGLNMSTISYEKKYNPNVGDHILKEDFINNEKNKKRPHPKRIDVAVPANLKCGRTSFE